MKAPPDERADLLQAAIWRATRELGAPIDRVEVVGDVDRVICSAGSRRVSLAVRYSPGYAPDPTGAYLQITAGGGSWNVEVVPGEAIPQGAISRTFAWLRRRLGA